MKSQIKAYFSARYNWHIALAFITGLIAATLVNDFPFIAEPLRNSQFVAILSERLAGATAYVIEIAGYEINHIGVNLRYEAGQGIYFDFGCLALRQTIWFAVFLLIVPGSNIHKIWYIPTGILIIQISNVLRAALIGISIYHAPSSFELVHVQGSLWYIYGTVLTLWLIWLVYFDE